MPHLSWCVSYETDTGYCLNACVNHQFYFMLHTAIPSGGVGVVIGSLIIYFTKSKGRNVALINWVVTLVALFPVLVFMVHCPSVELVGVTVKYPDRYATHYSSSSHNYVHSINGLTI